MSKPNDVDLTDEELLLLNNIMYFPDKYPFKRLYNEDYLRMSVDQLVEDIDTRKLRRGYGDTLYGGDISGDEWADMIDSIRENPKFKNIVLKAISKPEDGVGGICFEDLDGDAIVVFRGTHSGEWKDNFEGGVKSDTSQQEKALKWFEQLPYDNITVTGHSKGGNKSKYITIKSNKVSRCVSFNGQGFSPEFLESNQKSIQANKDKITSYALDFDFVNILLLDLGEKKIYIKGHGVSTFEQNHSPNSFFNENMELESSTQSQMMKNLHEFISFFINTASLEERKLVLDYFGEIAQKAFTKDTDGAAKYALDPVHITALTTLLSYLLQFEDITFSNITGSIYEILKEMGMWYGALAFLFSQLTSIGNNDGYLDTLEGLVTIAYAIDKQNRGLSIY